MLSTEDLEEHSRIFDKNNRRWNDDTYLNKMYLESQENWANDILQSRGFIFLFEVYEMLGFETTLESSRLGWVGNKGHIDFGLKYEEEDSAKLVFNIDGIVYDLLNKD